MTRLRVAINVMQLTVLPMAASHHPTRTPQEYIDETPVWADGTPIRKTPMTVMQWRIWALATAGKFFEGLVVFMTGVALPLLVMQWSLGSLEKGVAAAAPLLGILIGATLLGGLADLYGRKRMFIIEMVLLAIFLCGLVVSPSFWVFVIFLFGVGLALGCDYPTAHMVISESIPSSARGRLVLSAFAFQAVGALFGTALGFFILKVYPQLDAWRWMYGVAIIPTVLVVIGRLFITDSVHWLVAQGRMDKAAAETRRLLHRHPPYPREVHLKAPAAHPHHKKEKSYASLFTKKKNRRATILASIPWFLQDLSTYGIGIFTPTILAVIVCERIDHPTTVAQVVMNDMTAAQGAAFIDIFLIIGIVVAVLLADRIGRIRLQVLGFIGCALGLLLAALSTYMSGTAELVFVFVGFILFSFMTNIGPNAMTYLIAGEVFPTRLRGKGAGLAASIAKVGAVLTAFLFPVLLHAIGTDLLLYILVGTSLLGAWITWHYRIETRGKSLEELDHIDDEHPLAT